MADIEKLDPGLPRSSTYRHLVDLQAVGAVRAISANGEFTHFELAEDLTEHHHHIVCLSCGAIADVAATATFEAAMLALTKDITKRTGFVPMAHALDLVGHCATCARQHGASTTHH
jgi:Fe2+ or Zn2+ uptake regulation protein